MQPLDESDGRLGDVAALHVQRQVLVRGGCGGGDLLEQLGAQGGVDLQAELGWLDRQPGRQPLGPDAVQRLGADLHRRAGLRRVGDALAEVVKRDRPRPRRELPGDGQAVVEGLTGHEPHGQAAAERAGGDLPLQRRALRRLDQHGAQHHVAAPCSARSTVAPRICSRWASDCSRASPAG